jgi:hypothetical protein
MQIEPKTIAAQARLLAGSLETAALEGRELAMRQLLDAARRLEELGDDPGAEIVIEGIVPAEWLNEYGEPLVGFEHLDAA